MPPYSPDLNPIEKAFAKVKALLRRAGARTHETLMEAMGRALEAVTVLDARGFFAHCGYTVSCPEPPVPTGARQEEEQQCLRAGI